MTNQEIYEMYQKGYTYREIGELCGISKQAIHQRLYLFQRKLNGIRGHNFDINKIVYQGIYDWFNEHYDENISSLSAKLYASTNASRYEALRRFLIGENDTFFSIKRIKKLCEVIGKPFEEVFKRRDEV